MFRIRDEDACVSVGVRLDSTLCESTTFLFFGGGVSEFSRLRSLSDLKPCFTRKELITEESRAETALEFYT